VVIGDDLSDVFDNATFVEGSITSTVGDMPVLAGTSWSWTGKLAAGQQVVVTYQVKVNRGQAGELVKNTVRGEATPIVPDPSNPDQPGTPGTPITPPDVSTEQPIPLVPVRPVPPTPTNPPDLAFTGAQVGAAAALGGLLVLAGLVAVVVGRRSDGAEV